MVMRQDPTKSHTGVCFALGIHHIAQSEGWEAHQNIKLQMFSWFRVEVSRSDRMYGSASLSDTYILWHICGQKQGRFFSPYLGQGFGGEVFGHIFPCSLHWLGVSVFSKCGGTVGLTLNLTSTVIIACKQMYSTHLQKCRRNVYSPV